MQERRGTAFLAFVFWIQEGQMIFFKNMPLTFLKNIRLFNKKDHTPARAHPKRGHSSLLWNPGGSGKHAHHTHGGGAEFSSFAEERRSTRTPTRTGKAARKKDCFHYERMLPNAHGQGAPEKPSLSRKPFLSKRTITPPPDSRPQGTSKRGIR